MKANSRASEAATAKTAWVEFTRREWEVFRLRAGGCTSREAGLRLGISTSTANFHITRVYHKLGAGSITQAVRARPDVLTDVPANDGLD